MPSMKMQTMSTDGFCMVENSVTCFFLFFICSQSSSRHKWQQQTPLLGIFRIITCDLRIYAGPLKLNGVCTKLVRACQNLESRVLMGLESNTAIQNKWVDINQKKLERGNTKGRYRHPWKSGLNTAGLVQLHGTHRLRRSQKRRDLDQKSYW